MIEDRRLIKQIHGKYYWAEHGPKQLLPLPDKQLAYFLKNQNNCPLCKSTDLWFENNTCSAQVYAKRCMGMEDANSARAMNRSGYDHHAFWVKHCLDCGVLLIGTRWEKPEKGVRRRVMLDAFRFKAMLKEYGLR